MKYGVITEGDVARMLYRSALQGHPGCWSQLSPVAKTFYRREARAVLRLYEKMNETGLYGTLAPPPRDFIRKAVIACAEESDGV